MTLKDKKKVTHNWGVTIAYKVQKQDYYRVREKRQISLNKKIIQRKR